MRVKLSGHGSIGSLDEGFRVEVRRTIDNLNKPLGSMGLLESVAEQVCLVQHTLSPRLSHPCHLLFGGDHGIEREGVSASPREVTWQQMVNFTRGGGGVNMFCRQHGFELRIIDVGVDHDLSACPGIVDRKIARGTDNFLYGPAMSEEQFLLAADIGAEQVDLCYREGCNIVSIGEMGIANTSAASLWMHFLGGVPLEECVGVGSGLDTAGLQHKRRVLQQAADTFRGAADPGDTTAALPYFGGFEMAAAAGAMLRAAQQGMIIIVDGFIMGACMLAASVIDSNVTGYAVYGHCGGERGHRRLLALLGATPLLDIGLRLGEGTGALCAYPLIDSAVRMVCEMSSFNESAVTKYF